MLDTYTTYIPRRNLLAWPDYYLFFLCFFFILWLGLPRGHSITTWTRDGIQIFPYNIKWIHLQMSTRGRSRWSRSGNFLSTKFVNAPCSISPRVALGHQSSPPFMTSIIDQVSPHKVLFIKWLHSTMFKDWDTSGNLVTFWLVLLFKAKILTIDTRPTSFYLKFGHSGEHTKFVCFSECPSFVSRGELSLIMHIHIWSFQSDLFCHFFGFFLPIVMTGVSQLFWWMYKFWTVY